MGHFSNVLILGYSCSCQMFSSNLCFFLDHFPANLLTQKNVTLQIFQSRGALPHNLYPLDSVMRAFPSGFQPQQMPPLHSGGIFMETENQFPVNSLNAALRRSSSLQMRPTDGFGEAAPQVIEQTLS